MTEQNRIAQALSPLRASARTLEEVYQLAEGRKQRTAGKVGRVLLVAALLTALLALSAGAAELFGMEDSIDLTFDSAYTDGKVTVYVKNCSDKALRLQNKVKLMRWSTAQEVEPLDGSVEAFGGATVPAGETVEISVDLSGYDLAALEQPVPYNDWYYLLLTDANFLFGHDWQCYVEFVPVEDSEVQTQQPPLQVQESEALLQQVEEGLRPYFADISREPKERNRRAAEYLEKVDEWLTGLDITIVDPVTPMLLPHEPEPDAVFDPTFTAEPQYTLTGLHEHTMNWNGLMLGRSGDYASILSVYLPLKGYETVCRDLPIYYIFTYEKERVQPDRYVFIYGQLLTFAELEQYRVFEDESYVCYEVHELFYDDLWQHTQTWLSVNTDIQFNDSLWQRVQAVYDYYAGEQDFYYNLPEGFR